MEEESKLAAGAIVDCRRSDAANANDNFVIGSNAASIKESKPQCGIRESDDAMQTNLECATVISSATATTASTLTPTDATTITESSTAWTVPNKSCVLPNGQVVDAKNTLQSHSVIAVAAQVFTEQGVEDGMIPHHHRYLTRNTEPSLSLSAAVAATAAGSTHSAGNTGSVTGPCLPVWYASASSDEMGSVARAPRLSEWDLAAVQEDTSLSLWAATTHHSRGKINPWTKSTSFAIGNKPLSCLPVSL
jgi:hypothetical protein